MERVWGTHNSFHVAPRRIITKSMSIEMMSINHQLKRGARQIEIDIWWDNKEKTFKIYHLPFIDNESNIKTFDELLDLLDAYNDKIEHDGIYVLIEPKGIYSPFKNISMNDFLKRIDKKISSSMFYNEVVIPKDVLTTNNRVHNRRNFLYRAKNRIAFVLIDRFLARRFQKKRLESREETCLFISNEKENENCIFYNQNNPSMKRDFINGLVYNGFIVRTRMDVNGVKNKQLAEEAIISNAQIISTDFPEDFLNKTEKEIHETINTYSYVDDISHLDW